jgi:predicted Rossmann fold flavoprotein
LPSKVELSDFHTRGSQNALRNLFASWPLAEVRSFFERDLDLPLELEPETGKLFPRSQKANDVIVALERERERVGVELVSGFKLEGLEPPSGERPAFELCASDGRTLPAAAVVLATGGLSVPKSGSDGHGLALAERLGHRLEPRFPALVPLTTTDEAFAALSGVALQVRLSALRGERVLETREDALLFTHRGFSGPVVLDLSHHRTRPEGGDVRLCALWLGQRVREWDAHLRQGGRKTVGGLLREELPRRLVDLLCARVGQDTETRASALTRESRAQLVAALERFELPLSGDEGYRTAEVTSGGVALDEVVTRTLESRRIPGLFFAGEILDVTGRIGGFNFLWAWISGRLAGRAAGRAVGAR